MKITYRSTSLLGVLALPFILSACGGGGGSSNAGGPSGSLGGGSGTTTNSAITQANYQVVASASVAPMDTLVSASEATGMLVGGVEVNAPSASLAATTMEVYKHFRGRSSKLVTGVVFSEPCSGGGSILVDESVASQTRITVGDRVTLTANNCKESGMPTINGTLSLSIASVTGDPINSNRYSLGFTTAFQNFTVVSGNESVAITGDMALTGSQNGTSAFALSFSGQRLAFVQSVSGALKSTFEVTAYAFDSTESSGTVSLTGKYTVSGSAASLGGNYSYATEIVQPLRMSATSTYPTSGKIVVRGATASVTVTAVNASSVQVDYSASGNDVITSSNSMSWSAFEALN